MENIFITQAEFARLMNVSKQAVSKAIKENRISQVLDPKTGKLMLNAEMAASQWKKNSEVRVENSKIHNLGVVIPPDGEGIDGETDNSLIAAKTRSENLKAELLEIELKEKQGELISSEKVKKEAFKLARITRDGLLNIASQISNELAVENDPFVIAQKINSSITKSLRDLEEYILNLGNNDEESSDQEEEGSDE